MNENDIDLIHRRAQIARRKGLPFGLVGDVEGTTDQEIGQSVSNLLEANKPKLPEGSVEKLIDDFINKQSDKG